ncbi:tail assembly chaperone [Enterococcus faecium]|uniref:tail assembly chaperone n=1 Tax=Enterococcus faecium TaxID=1352 RepID=UPI000BF1F0A2|nr:tail assembly chaperone [Enterococcus faecium]PEH49301.1 hypothetical protein CRM75_16110 [Enterococcus faecium]
MPFTVNLKGKPLEIKFNYAMLFKANKRLGSKDKDGNSQNDGAAILFTQVLEEQDDALINLIKLAAKGEPSENDILDSIEEYVSNFENEETGYDQVFLDLKEEMLASGFFLKKIKKYISNLEKAAKVMENKEPSEEIQDPKAQAEAIKDLAEKMKKEISSSNVQDKG